MKHNDKWLKKQVEDYETEFAECEDELDQFKQKVLTWLGKKEKELREDDFYKFPDIDPNAHKLIKQILGEA